MADDVAPARLSAAQALTVIREIAVDSGRIVLIPPREDAFGTTLHQPTTDRAVLPEGHDDGRNAKGQWQVTLYRHAAGEEVTCVVAIEWATRLIVITTF
jgi:hypothetical protein